MKKYVIKECTLADLAELQRISRETFKATFDEYTTPADMTKFLKEDYATPKLTKEINNPNSQFFS